jgi:coiled-coil domain-containing protein 130
MQGFNMGRYHPPASLDSSLSNERSRGFNRTASGRRIAAVNPPTIRFEMPFAVWCTTCEPEQIIGQGVRFNARKSKVGNYHSSPIWAFEMKHTACGGIIEIRTDPKNSEYVVTKGGRRRDYGPEEDGQRESLLGTVVPADEKERRAADPFASLEGRVEEGVKVKNENEWVERLKDEVDRNWDDVWTANRRLRKTFRDEKKVLQAKERNREELTERLGLSIEVLDEVKEDSQRAALISYGESDQSVQQMVVASAARPLFNDSDSNGDASSRNRKVTKTHLKIEESKTLLQRNLRNNTRAVLDPFLGNGTRLPRTSGPIISGIKRKRPLETSDERTEDSPDNGDPGPDIDETSAIQSKSTILVDYESDDS